MVWRGFPEITGRTNCREEKDGEVNINNSEPQERSAANTKGHTYCMIPFM